MASPVDTSVKFFTSDMPNAPVLNGTAGSLIALLGACLVDGFNAVTLASLEASGGVMTATWSSGTFAALPHSVVLISGVTGGPTGYADANGEQKIVSRPSSLTATWATDLPDGTYTGTISMKMAPAGWEWLFSTTNKGVLRSLSPERHGQVLRIDDSAAQNARVVGYESMSDVDTGSGPFPTGAQVSGGGWWWKSGAANSSAVKWTVVSDGRVFYFWCSPYSYGAPVGGVVNGFGDPIARTPIGDIHSTFVGYNASGSITTGYSATGCLSSSANSTATTNSGVALARAVSGVAGAQIISSRSYTGSAGPACYSGITGDLGGISDVDGRLVISRRFLPLLSANAGGAPRADLPGIYSIPQSGAYGLLTNGDTLDGSEELAGRTLLVVNTLAATNPNTAPSTFNTGAALFDITGPWR